jgi:hypothetical protein
VKVESFGADHAASHHDRNCVSATVKARDLPQRAAAYGKQYQYQDADVVAQRQPAKIIYAARHGQCDHAYQVNGNGNRDDRNRE